MPISVEPTAAERRQPLPGDDLVAADVVMDRAFTLNASPDQVWPWLVQLGKQRAGWYLPHSIERWLPRRALRHLEPRWQELAIGDVIPDYGGKNATFTVAAMEAERLLLYRSRRGRLEFSWAIVLTPVRSATRVQLRLRLGPVRRRWLAEYGGGLLDWLTIAGLAAGLQERVSAVPVSD